jgi:lipoprotein-anchoring transpeptidase ErfK/SrfK
VKIKLAIFLLVILFFVPVEAVHAAPTADEDCSGDTYIVRPGDSLRKIARKCDTTLANLVAWNPSIINIDRIKVGQRINLAEPRTRFEVTLDPIYGATGSQTQVQVRNFPANTMIVIALGEDEENLHVLNQMKTDQDGSLDMDLLVTGEPGREWFVRVNLEQHPEITVFSETFRILEINTADGPGTYVVKRGDTLAKIAARYKRTISHLLVANPQITNPNRIFPGQEILIPGESEQVYTFLHQRSPEVKQAVANGERWIEVDITHQTVHAWEGEELVRSFLVSTGRPNTPTVVGQFNIWIKLRYDDMRGPGYHLRDVPYVMYFYKGYGLHGTYWHNDFGTPRSAGCVNLRTEDAEWLYNFADVGTLVSVH